MKLKVFFAVLFLVSGFVLIQGQKSNTAAIVTNPMNLNYRFQDGSYREAADPVCEYFKGKYYLFASKSGGYWSSTDLAEWTYIPCTSIADLNNYAPTILVLDDMLYFAASGSRIYRTDYPDEDKWVQINTKINLGTNLAFFQDDDGKVYIYWGCSDKDPIIGVEVDPTDGFRPIGSQQKLILHNEDRYGWERQGENNTGGAGWNEGPCINKYKGKYYLQYASPSTQYRTYAEFKHPKNQLFWFIPIHLKAFSIFKCLQTFFCRFTILPELRFTWKNPSDHLTVWILPTNLQVFIY